MSNRCNAEPTTAWSSSVALAMCSDVIGLRASRSRRSSRSKASKLIGSSAGVAFGVCRHSPQRSGGKWTRGGASSAPFNAANSCICSPAENAYSM